MASDQLKVENLNGELEAEMKNTIVNGEIEENQCNGHEEGSTAEVRSVTDDTVEEKKEEIGKQRKRKNKKKKKRRHYFESTATPNKTLAAPEENKIKDVEVEYVPESVSLSDLPPQYRQFFKIFEALKLPQTEIAPPTLILPTTLSENAPVEDVGASDEDEKKPVEKAPISNRKLKKMTRISVAELKKMVVKPNIVEMHDVNSPNPALLVQLKAYRNTVPVPRHWCDKRKYLQGKRGFEKPPFMLPEFIRKTGICEMRESYQEKDESKSLKTKMKERVRPKMGKIDIDYQKLHDAFFIHQSKPKLTIHGDLYYEGKELETKLIDTKPGNLSEELCTALGMPVNNKNTPPPWLIAMQRYGPPPSYSNMKIPGLNAPLPSGCSFGYHAGGWGKPPVNENGVPLYGDVFGDSGLNVESEDEFENNHIHWGEFESEPESEEEEEEKVESNKDDDHGAVEIESGLVTPMDGSEFSEEHLNNSVGLETPEIIELRKNKIEKEMDNREAQSLYKVLPVKETKGINGNLMGSTHTYDMAAACCPQPPSLTLNSNNRSKSEKQNGVTMCIDPEMDLNDDLLERRYKEYEQTRAQPESFSDMVLDHVNKQNSKRKRHDDKGKTDAKKVKKYKDFKF